MRNKPFLFWAVLFLVTLTSLGFCWRFRYAVFAGDMGVKYLQAMSFQQGTLQIDYPGQRFDPTGRAFPFEPPVVFPSPRGWVSVWLNPMVLFLVPLFDRLFGWAGYLVAPVLGGVLTIVALSRLGRMLHLPRPDLSAPIVWLVSPLLFYSLVLWEHTLAVGCGLMAVANLVGVLRGRESVPFGAGLWLGAAALFRAEAALAAGILSLGVWITWRKRTRPFPFILWATGAILPPLSWGMLVSWLVQAPTTAQVTYPYLSPYSPWSGNEWSRHAIKILQTLAEPFQDAPTVVLILSSAPFLLLMTGFFVSPNRDRVRSILGGVLLLVGGVLVTVQLATSHVFYSGIFASCPAMAALFLLRNRPQTRLLFWAWLAGLILLVGIAPNSGGLQRGCRYLLLPCVFATFFVVSETFRRKGSRRIVLVGLLLLGCVVQLQGVWVLWKHKASKETALEMMVSDKPDFVLTSVWYFPQEAGRIYQEVPILWTRTDSQIREVLIGTEELEPKPTRFLAVLPAQSSELRTVRLPFWEGRRHGSFGSLPLFDFRRTGTVSR